MSCGVLCHVTTWQESRFELSYCLIIKCYPNSFGDHSTSNSIWTRRLGSISWWVCTYIRNTKDAKKIPLSMHLVLRTKNVRAFFHYSTDNWSTTRDTAYLGVTIIFDFTIFASTILRTLTFRTKDILPTTVLLRTILRDGALYFAVILSGNVVWMICALTGRVWDLPFFLLFRLMNLFDRPERDKTYECTVSRVSFLSP